MIKILHNFWVWMVIAAVVAEQCYWFEEFRFWNGWFTSGFLLCLQFVLFPKADRDCTERNKELTKERLGKIQGAPSPEQIDKMVEGSNRPMPKLISALLGGYIVMALEIKSSIFRFRNH